MKPDDGQAKRPIEYGERVTPEDRDNLDVIHRGLASAATSADRREELEWVLAAYADKYCFDWLWEEPELKDHPDNPFNKGKAARVLTDGSAAGPTPSPPK